ncbi:tol-pal system YbgF family protein [Candidatus Neomarinimicrobiota bacterium]
MYPRQRSEPTTLPMRWGMLVLLFALVFSSSQALFAQNQQEEGVYLPDLGIVIEPESHDSSVISGRAAAGEEVDLLVGTAPPGAAFIESTKELRTVLDNLSGKINELEGSLNNDMDAVRLENERLRSLIRKIQTERKEAEVTQVMAETEKVEEKPQIEETPQFLSARPAYRDILRVYSAGQYEDVLMLSAAFDESGLDETRRAQLAYWRADACFRTGQFDSALQFLQQVLAGDHELKDDAIVLQGLIYIRQGQPRQARVFFDRIIQDYPSSTYYRLAELTIKELNHL